MNASPLIDPFQGKPGVFHFSTDALKKKLLFKDRKDYVFGANSIAIYAAAAGGKVIVLCYCLMSNHIHILVRGTLPDSIAFMQQVLYRLALHMAKRDGKTRNLRVNDFYIVPVTSRIQMKKEIAYILRNPYKAKIASPISYEWNSADVMFNPNLAAMSGQPLKDLSFDKRRQLFATRNRLPDAYEHIDGRILNKSFVKNELAQKCFHDDMDFFNELKRFNNESEVEGGHLGQEKTFFTDEELHEKMMLTCRNEYYVSTPAALDKKSLLHLATALRVRFGAGKEQLERILGLEDVLLSTVFGGEPVID